MNVSIRRTTQLALVIAVIGLSSGDQPLRACGPFFPRAVFRYTAHPEFPLEPYAAGSLGILAPTWARSQLVVAYRYLTGTPLAPAEQAGAVGLWNARYLREWDSAGPNPTRQWLEARSRIPGLPKIDEISEDRYEQKYFESWLNCGPAAFRTATATLTDRSVRHGDQPEMVRDWAEGQDAVFSNCGGDRSGSGGATAKSAELPPVVLMPKPVPAGAPDWLKADRQYQMAAAKFYGTDYAGAEQAFRGIASDASSPWHQIAPYLVARAMIRRGTIAGVDESLDQAEAQLKRILADASQSAIHRWATDLLSYVRGQKDPAGRTVELAARLHRPGDPADFRRDLTDYTLLLDRAIGETPELYATQKDPALGRSTARQDDMTDWIFGFQDGGAPARGYAVQRWRSTSALHWLLAALSKSSASDADVPALIEAGSRVAPKSPGYQTAIYHVLRLRIASGQQDEARTALDRLLPDARGSWPRDALNALLEMRMSLARSLDEALACAARRPAGETDDQDARELPAYEVRAPGAVPALSRREVEPAFDNDFGRLVNDRLPVNRIADAVRSKLLPQALRQDLAVAAWFRSAVLGDSRVASEVSGVLGGAYPGLKPLLDQYAAAQDDEARMFAAVFAALRFPGLRPTLTVNLGRLTALDEIDNYRDNWWCAAGDTPPPQLTFPLPTVLSQVDRQAGEAEVARIKSLPAAPNYLSKTAIAWAKRHPADARVPEALHLAVRSTRFGCADKGTTAFSKEAFTLLHRNYPASEWAKKTPYYY